MNDSKKKRFLLAPKPPFASLLLYKWKFATVISMFIFIFLFHGHFPLGSQTFQPVLAIHPLTRLAIRSFSSGGVLSPFKGVSRVLFPDQVLLLVSKNDQLSGVDCVYSSITGDEVVLPVLSVDQYTDLESIVRCPAPPANHSAAVDLRKRGDRNRGLYIDQAVHSWDRLVYAAVIDGKTAAVFVKGLNLRADRASDASQFSCHFGWGNAEGTTTYVLTTRAITAAQEVIRCLLPRSLHMLPAKAHGVRVTIGAPSSLSRHSNRNSRYQLPSVAKLIDQQAKERNAEKYELCACTMVWNQAPSLREWIAYHAWLGIERWFIYDNNSEDGIYEVINELDQENYNVSRHVWPWIKTQEAGFSHCALQAKKECKWVAFIDVDEYYYIPIPTIYRRPTDKLVLPGRNSLRSVVAKYSDSATVGEIRTACHSFGPSGLNKIPPRGVTVGYTCRLQSPERHKSIVRPDALDETLLTVVHHFHLKPEFKSFNLPQSTAVINHYKYQVWESFRAKFFRRVATYVADWQENQNEGSKDRAPGLGTEAIEPPNWSRQFCEVWDTGLRDFIMSNLADENSGLLPWERPPP